MFFCTVFFSTLQHLCLFDACKYIHNCNEELEEVIPQMKALLHLDISREIEENAAETYVTKTLLEKISLLPNLVYLDISGNAVL